MSNQKSRPDYGHWSKYDKWDFKEAAMLLHNLEPSDYLKVRFNSKDVPLEPELKEAHKTFLILKKCDAFGYSNFAHPKKILSVVCEKALDIPEDLLKEFVTQEEREQNFKNRLERKKTAVSSNELSTRERNVFLKAVALMAHMLVLRTPRFQVNNRPNPHQIAQAVMEKAESMGVDTMGLKSFERKITEALIFLEEEKESEF